jgi:hypothetical protein
LTLRRYKRYNSDMAKTTKPVYHKTCSNPLCLKDFDTLRPKKEHCSPKCRHAVFTAKRKAIIDRVQDELKKQDKIIEAAKELVRRKLELKVNMTEDLTLYHLYLAVKDLEASSGRT